MLYPNKFLCLTQRRWLRHALNQHSHPLEVRNLLPLLVEHNLHGCTMIICHVLISELGGIAPLFFSILPSHGHLYSKLSLAAQQFATLHYELMDRQDGLVALKFSLTLCFLSLHSECVFLSSLSKQTYSDLWEQIKTERGDTPRSSKVSTTRTGHFHVP